VTECRHLQAVDLTEEAIRGAGRMVILFESPWCHGCGAVERMIEGLSDEEAQGWVWGKVDVIKEQEAARRYGVLSLPTLLVFRDGDVVERMTGGVPREKLLAALG